ncbi:MAG TPA: glutamate synthase subunit beta [Acidimicrobiales bacterium]|nr:glutamate synthase subunit beta [Acidimicrobiales bacterium]
MPDPRGFLTVARAANPERDPRERVADHREVFTLLPWDDVREQARRCMGCGIPFCHHGCPLGNLIPEWNDLVRADRWREAIDRLHATNNFPEFTGYTCPAPCEPACVLEINDDPVMIKQVELAIIERAFEEGWVRPRPPETRTGRTVAVVGSGPAGLAAAAQLNYAGHRAVVYERDEAVGGLLRFGIPDFKLEKRFVERRVALLAAEGVEFRCGVDVGVDLPVDRLRRDHDAVVLALGSRRARPLDVPGADLAGVHKAMDYLYQRNRAVAREEGHFAPEPAEPITAAGKDVVVIGGGDTAADCIASAHREAARSVVQMDRYPQPQGTRPREITNWPRVPKRLPSTYALDEGGTRTWSEGVQALTGQGGHVTAVHGCMVSGPPDFHPLPGTELTRPADLVLVAIGFLSVEPMPLLEDLAVARDERGNVDAPGFATAVPGVFAAGDARRGQSLVVTAIDEGRRCAAAVDAWLRSSAP